MVPLLSGDPYFGGSQPFFSSCMPSVTNASPLFKVCDSNVLCNVCIISSVFITVTARVCTDDLFPFRSEVLPSIGFGLVWLASWLASFFAFRRLLLPNWFLSIMLQYITAELSPADCAYLAHYGTGLEKFVHHVFFNRIGGIECS